MVLCRRQKPNSSRIFHLPNYYTDLHALTFVALQARLLNPAGSQNMRKISDENLVISNLSPFEKIFPSL